MRNCFIIFILVLALLLPAYCDEHDRALVTYHFWLTYRELPGAANPIGLPESKFLLKGYSPVFGFSPLAILVNEAETDPLCVVRLRTEGFEEINPFKDILWRPNELESECKFKEDKKIKMVTAFIGNDSAVSTLVLSNLGKNPWKQELVFYSKGTGIIPEDYMYRKAITVTCPQKAGFSAAGIYFDKTVIEDISYIQESGRYRIIARVNVPAESAITVNIGIACAGEARTAATASLTAVSRNVYEMVTEKEVFFNRLLSNIPRFYNTDVSTRRYYQTAYLLMHGYRREDSFDISLRYIYEEKLKKILGKKLPPWMYWKAYEFTGEIKYLETAVANGEGYPKPENEVLEMYNHLTLDWAGSLLGKKAVYTPVVIPEGTEFKDEQKVLYMLLTGEDPKLIETEAKKLLNYKTLKYPETFFITDLLARFDIKGPVPALFEREMPFTQYHKDRTPQEDMAFMEMFFKSSGVDFARGNLSIQPLDLYKLRNIYNLKYKGNYLDIFYTREGRYIDKILFDGQPVNTRILYIPEADTAPVSITALPAGTTASSSVTNSTLNATLSSNPMRKIEIQLSSWPSNPLLNSIRTNSWYKVFKCGYDEKNAIFNIDMETPPLENWKATINITKNSKWIKKVTINWQDISKYEDIKIEYKEK